MTEQVEVPPEPDWSGGELPTWGEPEKATSFHNAPPLAFPAASAPVSRENHLITISITPNKAPMVVVRGDTAAEINQLFASLEREGVYVQMAAAEQALKNSAPPAETIVRQLGATPMAQQPIPPYQPGQPAPWDAPGVAGPPRPSLGPAPFGATTPQFQPPVQQGGWQGGGTGVATPVPPGWYAVSIPYQQNAAGKAVRDQLEQAGMRRDNVKFDKPNGRWLISPTVAPYFAQWNPVPA